jgi:sterol desaturase/sphingolipid hydroxylase (fatty acid hydroxylase superfamily)
LFGVRINMTWLALEHSPTVYQADFAFYGSASVSMAFVLIRYSPSGRGGAMLLWALAGGTAWTLIEYVLHRFVLHGMPPFNRWHAEHHQRPTALIASPTVFSAALFGTLAALPGWWLLGAWPACALTFGLMTGYLAYGLTHHATHHPPPWLRGRSVWLLRRRQWHAMHHGAAASGNASTPGHFGVSSSLWDHVFGTRGRCMTKRATPVGLDH